MRKKASNSISSKIAKKLRQIRRMKNITQSQVAVALEVTPQQIASYEVGKSQITLERFVQWSTFLQTDSIQIFLETIKEQQ